MSMGMERGCALGAMGGMPGESERRSLLAVTTLKVAVGECMERKTNW